MLSRLLTRAAKGPARGPTAFQLARRYFRPIGRSQLSLHLKLQPQPSGERAGAGAGPSRAAPHRAPPNTQDCYKSLYPPVSPPPLFRGGRGGPGIVHPLMYTIPSDTLVTVTTKEHPSCDVNP
ncbi:MAG: hypothetical protein [Arizlama microvirus]|nr:MAG: hypothetical protein [Arizlama microvirus]